MYESSYSKESCNLRKDAELCTLLEDLSLHVQQKSYSLSQKLQELERKMHTVENIASGAILEFMDRKDNQPTHFEIFDSECGPSCSRTDKGVNGEIIEDENVLREEENNAILDGIAALKYFHDHSVSLQDRSFIEDHYFHLDDVNVTELPCDDENDGDDTDASAKADIFDQRPLPYIIGSKAFMESNDAGLGNEDEDAGSSTSE